LNQKGEREKWDSQRDEINALSAEKAAQTEPEEARHQHIILEKRKDAHLRGHPSDHQQFQKEAENARED
jgi:hypothetical protein